jgi:apoptosis-inducing factor 3
MGDTNTKLVGPDLRQGLDVGSLQEGKALLGHADGEAVLVTRVAADILAIGATCTHYGGPLAEGLIVGDEVRCPWHHACFSLRTGIAMRAPALNPVSCWTTEVRDGRVFVTGKTERDPLAPSADLRPGSSSQRDVPERIVIIGAGAAGSAAAEMLRREGFQGSITMVDAEPDSPYDRPNLSKDYLAGNAPEEWIPLRPPTFYADHGIDVIRARATRIDAGSRQVEVEGRASLAYDALLLATGAEPVRLTLPGAERPHVHYLRSLADSRTIIAGAKTAKHALVIGASFIGLEVAASLRARGCSVDVVGL